MRKLPADGNTKFEISLKNDEVSKLDGNSITVFFFFFVFLFLLAKGGFVISVSMVERFSVALRLQKPPTMNWHCSFVHGVFDLRVISKRTRETELI